MIAAYAQCWEIRCWPNIWIKTLVQHFISSHGLMLQHWNVGPTLCQHEVNISTTRMGQHWTRGQSRAGPISEFQRGPNHNAYVGLTLALRIITIWEHVHKECRWWWLQRQCLYFICMKNDNHYAYKHCEDHSSHPCEESDCHTARPVASHTDDHVTYSKSSFTGL